jgi:hypothetical protein
VQQQNAAFITEKRRFFSAADILSVGKAKNTGGTKYVCTCLRIKKAGRKGNHNPLQPANIISSNL